MTIAPKSPPNQRRLKMMAQGDKNQITKHCLRQLIAKETTTTTPTLKSLSNIVQWVIDNSDDQLTNDNSTFITRVIMGELQDQDQTVIATGLIKISARIILQAILAERGGQIPEKVNLESYVAAEIEQYDEQKVKDLFSTNPRPQMHPRCLFFLPDENTLDNQTEVENGHNNSWQRDFMKKYLRHTLGQLRVRECLLSNENEIPIDVSKYIASFLGERYAIPCTHQGQRVADIAESDTQLKR